MVTKKPRPNNRTGLFSKLNSPTLATTAEEAQQEQEQIHEIQVQRERAQNRSIIVHFLAFGNANESQLLELLGVVGGQGGEENNADEGT